MKIIADGEENSLILQKDFLKTREQAEKILADLQLAIEVLWPEEEAEEEPILQAPIKLVNK